MTRKRARSKRPKKRGPEPERLILSGKWKDAVKQALKKKPTK